MIYKKFQKLNEEQQGEYFYNDIRKSQGLIIGAVASFGIMILSFLGMFVMFIYAAALGTEPVLNYMNYVMPLMWLISCMLISVPSISLMLNERRANKWLKENDGDQRE